MEFVGRIGRPCHAAGVNRILSKVAVVASLKLLSGVALLLAAAPLPTQAAMPQQVAELRPLEVRIRKLHVVRPDLLRFPMQYDVYC